MLTTLILSLPFLSDQGSLSYPEGFFKHPLKVEIGFLKKLY